MSYQLSFYALDHARLQAAFGSGDQALVDRILVDGDLDDEAQDALRELVLGERGRELAQRPAGARVERASAVQAVAIAAMVTALGVWVGETSHASGGAGGFLDLLTDARYAPPQFADHGLAWKLIGHPIAGLENPGDFPQWGGLDRPEMTRFVGDAGTVFEPPDDGDIAEWSADIHRAVRAALAKGRDLVTIYG